MDHLPVPIDGHRVIVPWYALKKDYQPGDFYSFPEEYGYKANKLIEDGLDSQMNPKEANEFLQSWLFFCLLARVLDEPISHSMFLGHASDCLHTENLRDLLKNWAEREKNESVSGISRQQKDRFLRASFALSGARKFVSKHLSTHRRIDREDLPASLDTPTLNREGNSIYVGLDTAMTLSLAILGETLEHSRPDILPELLESDRKFWRLSFSQEESWGYSKYNRDTMRKNGHCPMSIRRLEAITPSVSVMYYASAMKPAYHDKDTSRCSSQICNGQLRYPDPLHMGCEADGSHNTHGIAQHKCETFEFGEEELVRIINAGKTPMVKFSTSEGLQRVEYDLGTAGNIGDGQELFGVLSHSWSEGIVHSGEDHRKGNNRAMHQCQLATLQHTLNGLLKTYDKGVIPANYPFFVDVLCFPRQHTVQKLAIKQLRDIYQKSSAVVIWDRDLLKRVKSDDYIEINMRIRTCDWSNRLWTLQEAVLAKRLYVGLSHGATVGIEDIRQARKEAKDNPAHDFHHVWKAGHPFSLPIWKLRPERNSTIGVPTATPTERDPAKRPDCPELGRRQVSGQEYPVARVWQAVQHRQVEHPEDEAIVLANVLGLDVEAIQEIGEGERTDEDVLADRRMAKLLEMIEEHPTLGTPSGIIFLPGPKLSMPGVQWAPKT